MAKGKYQKWLTPDGLLLLEGWARDGLTDEQIADKIGISRSTLSEWKKRFPDISDAIKKSKEIADYQVENALFKSAIGFKETVKKPIKLKYVSVENGVRKEAEKIEYVEEEIYIKPDVTAEAMWLKHRQPEKWGDNIAATIDAPVINIHMFGDEHNGKASD